MSVTIILPDNKRLTVKASVNDSLSKVLEKVCENKGLDSSKYSLQRNNKNLDLSLSLRLANVPLNSEINLVYDENKKCEQQVQILLQFKDMERKLGVFSPDSTLWHVVESLFAQELSSDMIYSVNYLNRQFEGQSVLQNTTLRVCGIIGGRASLRLNSRSKDEPGAQQKFVENLNLKKIESKPSNEEKTPEITLKMEPEDASCRSTSNSDANSRRDELKDKEAITASPNAPLIQKNVWDEISRMKQKGNTLRSSEQSNSMIESTHSQADQESLSTQTPFEFTYLGENEEVLYSLDEATGFVEENIPDEFFDHSASDLRYLLAELRKQQKGSSENALETKQQREERERNQLSRFEQSIIRVVFPFDRLVLQAIFNTTDSIQTVLNTLAKYTTYGDLYLFTAPPKNVLAGSCRLNELRLVPSGLVYCNSTQNTNNQPMIIEEFKSKTTSYFGAGQLAAKKMKLIFQKSNECK